MDKFCPTWKELLHPVRLPIKQLPLPDQYRCFEVEPDWYVDLGIRDLDFTDDFNEKIRQVIEKDVAYADFGDLNTELIDENQLLDCSQINLLPDNETASDDEHMKIVFKECLQKVLGRIPCIELAEHGIIIQTYRILESEFDKSHYQKRVNEIVTEFLNETVVHNNIIRRNNIMQVFLYGISSHPGRIFIKYSTDRSKKHIEHMLKDFIEQSEKRTELEQLIELLYLEHYRFSPTLFAVLKSVCIASLTKRHFFKDIISFMESPYFQSATHGLQRLCRRKLLFYFIKSHIKFLITQLKHLVELSKEEEDKICKIFLQTCFAVLALPKFFT